MNPRHGLHRIPDHYAPQPRALVDRVILITGAAQGIGRAVALAAAAHGATVVLHGRRARRLEPVYDEIEAAGGPQPAMLPLDFAKAGDHEFDALASTISAQLGRLDGIVHNAAHLEQPAPLEHTRVEHWLGSLRTNFVAVAGINRACAPLLRAAPDAAVVLTLETHALEPSAFWGAFAVSKAALTTLLAVQADEWSKQQHLRINAVLPGPVASPQRARTHPGEAQTTLPAPEALLPTWLYLLGPDSRGISGRVWDAQPQRG